MEDNRQVLIKINIDEGTYRAKILSLSKEIGNVRKEQLDLAKAIKVAGTATDEQIEQQLDLKNSLQSLSKEQKRYQDMLNLKAQADDAAAGSVDQLRAQTKLLRTEWDALSKEEKENAEVGGELAKQIASLNTELADQAKQLKANADAQTSSKGFLNDLQEQAKILKKEYAALSEEELKNAEVGGVLAEQITQINTTIKEHGQSLRATAKVQEHAVGSVYALREEYGELQKAFYSLGEEERKSKVGQKMQKDLLELNQSISAAENSIGVFSRNVGNYSKSILEAFDSSGQLSGAIETLKSTYEGLSEFISAAKESIISEAKAKMEAKAATDAQTGATKAGTAANNISKASIIGNVAALKLLKFALIATGIGAFVILIGGLLSFLLKTQEGMNKLAQITGGFGASLDFLTHRLAEVGKGLTEIVSATGRWFKDIKNLGDLLRKLGDGVLANLTSRMKGFAVIWDGIRSGDGGKLADGFIQAGTGISNATTKVGKLRDGIKETVKEAARAGVAMAELIKLEQDLNREKVLNASTSKLLLRDIEALKNIRDDETKTLKERQEANAKAYELEKRRNDELSDLAKREMDILIDKAAVTAKLSQADAERIKQAAQNNTLTQKQAALLQLTDEELQNVITAQNELFDIQEDSNGKQNEFITNRVSLVKEASEQEKAIIEKRAAKAQEMEEKQYDALIKRLEDERAALEVTALQAPENTDERLQSIIELSRKEMEIELSQKDLTENQKKLIQVKFNQDEIEARREHAQELIDIAREQAETFARIKKEEYAQAQQYTDTYYAEQRLKATQALADGSIGQEQYQEQMEQQQLRSLQNQLQNAREYGESTVDIEQRIAELKINTRQREADEKARIAEAEMQLAMTVAQGLGDLATILAGQGETASEFSKAVALFELTISTANAMSNIIEGSAVAGVEVAKVSGAAAPIAAPIAAATYYATNVAMILANVAKAKALLSEDAPTAPKFRTGGVLRGPSHERGGIQIYNRRGEHLAEAEGGEPILTAAVSRNPKLLAAASAINVAAGGQPLVPTRYAALGGTLPLPTREYLTGQAMQAIDYDRMAQAMKQIQVMAAIKEIQAVGNRVATKMHIREH